VSPLALLALLAAAPADTLVVGLLADPITLSPHRATDLVSQAILANVSETLVRLRPDSGRPEAALATTWATVDHRTWTFTLREDVRFHDGAVLDADAVVANLESMRRERSFSGTATRLGPNAVSITLERPNAALLSTLSQPYFALQSPRQLRPNARAVGTGPFRLTEDRPGAVGLQANPAYWGGVPRLQHVTFRKLANEDALIAALLAGEVDVSSAIGPDRVADLRSQPDITLDSHTGLNVAFLSINNERAPFSDRRVRQALSRAADRHALVARFLGGHGERARNPLPPSLLGHSLRTRELVLDRPGARRLLAEAGFPDGFDTTLLSVDSPRPYMPAPGPLAAALRDQLAEVGIRATLRMVSTWSEYLERATRGDYDLAILGWQADSPDPNDFLSALLASESIGTTNRSRYRSPAMDALLKRARMESEGAERVATYREAQELFQADMPWVPLYHVPVFTAYRNAVRGLVPGPTGLLRYDKAWKLE
jgi:peptide/nickel transport system substrate-binding protein